MSGRRFLDRWSERKRAAQREAAEPPPGSEEAPEPTVEAGSDPAEGARDNADETVITDEELARLVPIDAARSPADLRPYLQKGVPAALKRAALRRIWTLNPRIRDYVDPALDYAWDFNKPTGGATFAEGVVSLTGTLLRERLAVPEANVPVAAEPGQEAEPAAGEPQAAGRTASVDDPEAAPKPVASEERATRRRHGGAVPRIG